MALEPVGSERTCVEVSLDLRTADGGRPFVTVDSAAAAAAATTLRDASDLQDGLQMLRLRALKPGTRRSKEENATLVRTYLGILNTYTGAEIFPSRATLLPGSPAECERDVSELLASTSPSYVAFDAEWDQATKGLDVIQIATDAHVCVYQTRGLPLPPALARLLTDGEIVKFGVVLQDRRRMRNWFDVEISPLVDLGRTIYKSSDPHWTARGLLGETVIAGSSGGPWVGALRGETETASETTLPTGPWTLPFTEATSATPSTQPPVGLQALTARLLGLFLPKNQRHDDWSSDKLSDGLVTYAARDACAIFDCVTVQAYLESNKDLWLEAETRLYEWPATIPTLTTTPRTPRSARTSETGFDAVRPTEDAISRYEDGLVLLLTDSANKGEEMRRELRRVKASFATSGRGKGSRSQHRAKVASSSHLRPGLTSQSSLFDLVVDWLSMTPSDTAP